MSEMMKLSELNGLVKRAISGAFPAKLWVIGEISEMKSNRNGHCYLNLIEKDTATDAVIAQARATIWSYVHRMLRPYFETTTGQVLIEGLKVLVQVTVEFHELYGYSLNIHDIDPTYTLGDLAKRKTEIINRLIREGVFDMNKEVDFPEVPQRIAVISSESAAGFQDFTNQLKDNQAGFAFYVRLFPAIMQGTQTEASVINALDQIYQYEDLFDVVVIIRGGGSQFDLSCFDNFNIAYHITQFPLPVITGIGHEKDNSVVDMVAHTRLKTPTAVAEFLIGGLAKFDLTLEKAKGQVIEMVQQLLDESNREVERMVRLSGPLIRGKVSLSVQYLHQTLWKTDHQIKMAINRNTFLLVQKEEEIRRHAQQYLSQSVEQLEVTGGLALTGLKIMIPVRLEQLSNSLATMVNSVRKRIVDENHRLKMAEQEVYLTDPRRVLSRGYSITTLNGMVIKDMSMVNPEDIIQTTLYKGKLYSKVIKNK